MLEFVLMLPLIWLVLALSFSFGAAFLERQRAMVAVREVGLRHHGGDARPDAVMTQVTTDLLRDRTMSAQFSYRADDGTCARDGESADDRAARGALAPVLGFLRRVSSSRTYEIHAVGQATTIAIVPTPRHRACFAIDGGTWTYSETGSPVGFVVRTVGGALGSVGSALFR